MARNNHANAYGNFGKSKPKPTHTTTGDPTQPNRLRRIRPKAHPV